MSWADPCLVKKLWLIHTIFECSVLLAVVFFWWRVFCEFSCFSLYSSFFLIDARICPDYIFLLIKRSLSKKNQKENYPSKWIWKKKKLTDGKINSVVKTCRKVKWNKIEVNFVGVMYIIWKLYDWNSLKIACNFKFEANARLITVKHNLMSWRWQLAKLHGNYSKRKVLKIFSFPA